MPRNKRISYTDYLAFQTEYRKDPGDERFGQAFLNRFFPTQRSADPRVFHEESRAVASALILQKYVTYGEEER
jgi:hypothetical protein